MTPARPRERLRLEKTAHHTPKGQVDSETEPWWIQVDSSGFRWIRTRSTLVECAPVYVLSMWQGGFSATASTPYNIRRGNDSNGGPKETAVRETLF